MSALRNLQMLRAVLEGDTGTPCGAAFDHSSFRRFVAENQLAATVYSRTRSNGGLPPETLDHFKFHYLQQWGKNEALVRQCAKIHDALESAGLAHCFLKGLGVAQRYYGDIDARYTRDIDVLVQRDDFAPAEKALAACGIRRRSHVLISDAATMPFTHHFEYLAPGVEVELHWSLAEHVSFRLDSRSILRDRIEEPIGNYRFPIPSDEHALMGCVLGAFRDIELGTCTLKPMLDIFQMLSQMDDETDWPAFFERRREEKVMLIALNIISMALQLWDARDSFPNLTALLERHRRDIRLGEPEASLAILTGKPKFASRRWAWSLYETHPVKTFCWWAVSLPFRMAVSPSR
jgi:hypothetical protein